MNIKSILENYNEYLEKKLIVHGWINNARVQTNIVFISINDGSCQTCLQCVINLLDSEKTNSKLGEIQKGCSVRINGILEKSPAQGQDCEFSCCLDEIEILGTINLLEYPLSGKKHSLDFLRDYPHLRIRTNTFSMMARVRNTCTLATHLFFQDRGYLNVHTPLITSNDCEGAGETFNVTIDSGNDFFAKKAFLTVSGQLHGESYALGLSNIYTFGPTFRAENSNTSRHLAEFWMVEPEASFIDFNELMQLGEQYIKFCVQSVIDRNKDDLDFIDKFISKGKKDFLHNFVKTSFKRLTYTEAHSILLKDHTTKSNYKKPGEWGCDLSSDQEKYITQLYGPTIVYDYPKDIKSFYMKINSDNKTVQAMDILVPTIGEIIGGSMREDSYEVLQAAIDSRGINTESLQWYIDLRKFGTAPHGGFGLGFERLIMLITGLTNIKDCIPYPRYPNHCVN